MLIKNIQLLAPSFIIILIGVFLDCILGGPICELIIAFGLVNIPITYFRFFIWDFKATFLHLCSIMIGKTNTVVGIILTLVISFFVLVSIGYLRPSLDSTYRYKQINYEIGDEVLVGDYKHIAIDLDNATVVDTIPSEVGDGEHNGIFFADKYVLDNGKTVSRTQIFGKKDNMNGLLWIPKSYYYGSKYVIQCTYEFVKWAFTPES